MGAGLTTNASSTKGIYICGKTFTLLNDVNIVENCSDYTKYYIQEPSQSNNMSMKYNENEGIVNVENVYTGMNLPDVGEFHLIIGTVSYNGKDYDKVTLNNLFVLEGEEYVIRPNMLHYTGKSFKYDDKLITKFIQLTMWGGMGVIHNNTTSPIKFSKLDSLKEIIQSELDSAPVIDDKCLEHIAENYQSHLKELSEWDLQVSIQEILCYFANCSFVEANMRYLDVINNTVLTSISESDNELINEIRHHTQ